jgi:hypothetical protein
MYGPRYMMFECPEEVRGGRLCFGVLCLFESIGKVCPSGETPANNIILLYWLSSRNARCLHEGEMKLHCPSSSCLQNPDYLHCVMESLAGA